MGTTLDSILNYIIPPIIVVFIIWIIYYPFRVPLGKMWDKIRSWRENARYNREMEFETMNTIYYE